MKNNAILNVGDTVIFNNTGGTCRGSIKIGNKYIIKSLSQKYRTIGDCNAILCNGAEVRMSTVKKSGRTDYTTLFEVVGGRNYEIY
jgi:hypothetical protein